MAEQVLIQFRADKALKQDVAVTPTIAIRILINHNFAVRFVETMCLYLQTDVSNVIEFQDTSSWP